MHQLQKGLNKSLWLDRNWQNIRISVVTILFILQFCLYNICTRLQEISKHFSVSVEIFQNQWRAGRKNEIIIFSHIYSKKTELVWTLPGKAFYSMTQKTCFLAVNEWILGSVSPTVTAYLIWPQKSHSLYRDGDS